MKKGIYFFLSGIGLTLFMISVYNLSNTSTKDKSKKLETVKKEPKSKSQKKGVWSNIDIIGNWDVFDRDNNGASYVFNSNGTGNFLATNGANYPFVWSYTNDMSKLNIILNKDKSVWKWDIVSSTSNSIKMYSSQHNLNREIKKNKILFSSITNPDFLIGEWKASNGTWFFYDDFKSKYIWSNYDAVSYSDWSYNDNKLRIIHPSNTNVYIIKHVSNNKINMYFDGKLNATIEKVSNIVKKKKPQKNGNNIVLKSKMYGSQGILVKAKQELDNAKIMVIEDYSSNNVFKVTSFRIVKPNGKIRIIQGDRINPPAFNFLSDLNDGDELKIDEIKIIGKNSRSSNKSMPITIRIGIAY